jgi:RNA polymerase sigma-70 factor (ECF subfamily)
MIPLAHSTPSDQELILSVASGNLQSLGDLFDRYESEVKRFIGRLGVNPADADDLVQATFLDVLHAAARFDPELSAKSWLFGLAAMIVRRHRRTLSRAAARLMAWAKHPLPELPPTPAAAFEADQELRRFQIAFERLSSKKREVFALLVLEGINGEEAAKTLGIPVNTVWTRLHHARRDLRAELGKDEA